MTATLNRFITAEAMIHCLPTGMPPVDIYMDHITEDSGGNKSWKLATLLQNPAVHACRALISTGGAFSNSLLAVSAAAKKLSKQPVLLVRGDELAQKPLNPLLAKAVHEYGGLLRFITRRDYRDPQRRSALEEKAAEEFDGYIIPEGVACFEGYEGVKHTFSGNIPDVYQTVCLPCATGTTLAGLIAATQGTTVRIRAYGVLHNQAQLLNWVRTLLTEDNIPSAEWHRVTVTHRYAGAGFAKASPELQAFVRNFAKDHGILTDYRYAGKMMFGVLADHHAGVFAEGRILCLHTGGFGSGFTGGFQN